MFKKIFLHSLITNFFFTKKIFAAESGGMPQLDPEFWLSQIFWLIASFGTMFVVLSKIVLPKISSNLESRKSQILTNIETAENQRKQTEEKIKEFDNIILEPVAKVYNKLPEPVRNGTGNFTSNIATLLSIPNHLLQGKLSSAGHATGSFIVNSTIGIWYTGDRPVYRWLRKERTAGDRG